LEHGRRFLAEKNPLASLRAGQLIEHQFSLRETGAEIGRPLDDYPDLRELVIPFGESGYVALYRYVGDTDTVYVLAFRYQKEAGC
jgi:plasmid stabilization system protein ParE